MEGATPISISESPRHSGLLLTALATVGAAFTVTEVVAVLVKPLPSVTVTVYTVVTVGVAVTGVPVVLERPVAGAQVKLSPGSPEAERVSSVMLGPGPDEGIHSTVS